MTPNVQSYPGCVIVTGPALNACADAVLIAIRSRRLSGFPHSKVLEDLAAAFIRASVGGHVDVPDVVIPASSPTVPINDDLAKRMNLSKRQIRRMAEKLGGQIVSGRWLLDEQSIQEHLEGHAYGSAA
jgi:hypothetical protein